MLLASEPGFGAWVGMAFIEWHDHLAVGVSKLDQEHRELVALVGDLFTTANSAGDIALFELRMDLLIKSHTSLVKNA
jgi:hemerythrin